MQPAQVAALLARETEDGLLGALRSIDSPGLLVVEHITARVAAVPDTEEPPDWSALTWQAETRFRVQPPGASEPDHPVLLPVLAALPVRALHGAGAVWAQRLVGLPQIGDLATASSATVADLVGRFGRHVAVLTGRAQSCSVTWSPGLTEVCRDRANAEQTVLSLAKGDPKILTGSADDAVSLWAICLRITAAVDGQVLGGIPLGALPPSA